MASESECEKQMPAQASNRVTVDVRVPETAPGIEVDVRGPEAMGWLDRVGSIEKGKYADIVAVSGNPLTDISELQRVKFVMKGGKVIRNDRLAK